MSDALVIVGSRSSVATKLAAAKPITPRTPAEIREIFARRTDGVWLASKVGALAPLAGLASPLASKQRLLLLSPADAGDRDFLRVVFRYVVDPTEVRLLPTRELLEVLASPDRADRFIGGAVAENTESVVLYRGTLDPVVVPKAWFVPRPKGPKPDFGDLEVIDFGQTVRLGEYEAASDAILYEFDPAYRRRARRLRIDQDRSFGGALRRLRLQKGLSRSDFPGISAKQVARLERGESGKPHSATLKILADRLGVAPADIASY